MDRSESSEQNLKTVLATHVSAKNATIRSVNYNPLSGNDEITLFWKISDVQLQEDCAKALTLYTSSLNTDAKYFVDDPIGSREEYRGRWRNSSVQMIKHGDEPGILQKLSRGYLREIPAYDEDDDVARIIGMRVDPTTGKYVVVRAWDGVDPDYVEQAVRARKSLVQVTRPAAQIWTFEQHYVPDPRAGEKRFPGIYAVSDVTATPLEDGAFRVSETLTEILQVNAYTDLAGETPLATQSRETLDLFGLQSGDADSMAFVFSKLSNDSRAACMAFKASELESILTPENVQAVAAGAYKVGDIVNSGGEYYVCTNPVTYAGSMSTSYWALRSSFVFASSTFQEQDDNTAKFSVLFRRVHWQTWVAAKALGPRKMARGNPGHEQEVYELQWLGIDKQYQSTVSDDAVDALVAGVTGLSAYVAASSTVRDNGNGSITLTIQALKPLATHLLETEIDRPHDFKTSTFSRYKQVWEDYAYGSLAALGTTPPIANYVLVRRSETGPTSSGLYGLTVLWELPAHNAWSTTPDIVDYSNFYTGTDKRVSNHFLAVKRTTGGLNTAIAALVNAAPPAGFVTTDVAVSNRGDGAVDLTQNVRSAYTASTYTGSGIIVAATISPKNITQKIHGMLVLEVNRVITADIAEIKTAMRVNQVVGSGAYGEGTYVPESTRDSDNGDGTHNLAFTYKDYLPATVPDDPNTQTYTQTIVRQETQTTNNVGGGTTVGLTGYESYYWRIVEKTIVCEARRTKFTTSDTAHASGKLSGSFSRYQGNGIYYAEVVTIISVSAWTNKKYNGVWPGDA